MLPSSAASRGDEALQGEERCCVWSLAFASSLPLTRDEEPSEALGSSLLRHCRGQQCWTPASLKQTPPHPSPWTPAISAVGGALLMLFFHLVQAPFWSPCWPQGEDRSPKWRAGPPGMFLLHTKLAPGTFLEYPKSSDLRDTPSPAPCLSSLPSYQFATISLFILL